MISQTIDQARIVHDGQHCCPTYGGRTIECRIRIVENRWNTIVIATDLSNSIYSSITLHTEELATTICDSLRINQETMLWIEHIPARPELGRSEDLYDLVHFQKDEQTLYSPHWTPLTEEEVDLLTEGLLATQNVE